MLLKQSQKKRSPVWSIIRLMRPQHYLKNLLLFVAIVFSGKLFDPASLLQVVCGFFSFSILSSAIYTLNDIIDVESDRLHERKRNRPIASGEISIPVARGLAVLFFLMALLLNALVPASSWKTFPLLLLYFAVNLGYSMGLKHVPFLDLFLLVLGFLIRVLYGAALISESVSNWVSLTVISLSFYLGLGKRRNELKKGSGKAVTRHVLQFYSVDFLDKFMYLCLALAIVFYALWSADSAIIIKYGANKLIWTVPFIILLTMKYSADVESDSHGDPVDVILGDRALLVMGIIYAFAMIALIYIPGI